jgi:cellulose synthase/poly-beta-1,6-N-acetylglucosamine synthase-like glycosyltransferase
MFRPRALREVAEQRGNTIPGNHGDVYDTVALTEDNELTIALKTLGALMISPSECRVVTELMPTLATLWRQRLRWQRGALENIGAYGITPATFRYWAQQIGIGYSVIALYAFMLMMAITVLAVDRWIWFPFWAGLGILFVTERVVTVWKGGWRARVRAALLFPELLFDMYLNTIYVKGIIDLTLGRQPSWTHLPSVAANSEELAA